MLSTTEPAPSPVPAAGAAEPVGLSDLLRARARRRVGLDRRSFKVWIDGSAAVDADGSPGTFFHGTTVWELPDGRSLGVIDRFDRLRTMKALGRRPGIDTVGSWFSSSSRDDSGAGMYAGPNGAIYPVYLAIKSPMVTTFDGMVALANRLVGRKAVDRVRAAAVDALRAELARLGHDGLKIVHNTESRHGSTEFLHQDAWIALEPEQVRFAIVERGMVEDEAEFFGEAVMPDGQPAPDSDSSEPVVERARC